MKKIILGLEYLTMAVLLLLFFGFAAAPVLSFEEGWHTFYYDSDYLSVMMADGGLGCCIKAFFLQFYAQPWHGAVILTILSLLVMLLCGVCFSRFCKRRLVNYIGTPLTTIIFVFAFTWWLSGTNVFTMLGIGSDRARSNITYMSLSDMSRKGDWDGIIAKCDDQRITNILFQNILNMALAEKCELGDKLLDQPVSDIRSIYISDFKEPEVAGMLSDVFFSMGHLSESQMYAFEANEKMDNLSPRMLQRLVQTNTAYGNYEVARKYIDVLRHTLYYGDWCDKAESLLSNEAVKADPVLSQKRLCIFPGNRFAGVYGIDDDLLQVARCTRGTHQCKTTLQFLGSLYILADYEKEFVSMIDEFGGSKDMPKPLPEVFAKFYDHLMKKSKTQ